MPPRKRAATVRGPEPDWRTVNEKLLEQIAGHLFAARYQEAAEVLNQLRRDSQWQGAELSAQMLDVARGLCLACDQHRATAHWHQEASAQAAEREQELQDQLRNLLDLLSGESALPGPEAAQVWSRPGGTGAGQTDSMGPAALLTRLWTRLVRRPTSRPTEAAPPDEPSSPISSAASVAGATDAFPSSSMAGPATQAGMTPALSLRSDILSSSKGAISLSSGDRFAHGDSTRVTGSAPALAVYCLGSFRVYQNNLLISDWKSLKGQSILKYLLACEKRMAAKEVLMELFWPDCDIESARRNLHQAVYSLRKTLKGAPTEPQYILFEHDYYLLDPGVRLWLDFEEMETRLRAGRMLEHSGQASAAMAEYSIAESLYLGEFLEEDLYEDWPRVQRQHLHALYLDTADRLSRAYVEKGDYAPAVTLCHKILTRDRCYEAAYRRLMKCYMAQGQRHLAVHQYQICIQAMQEELDLTPSSETEALYRRITG